MQPRFSTKSLVTQEKPLLTLSVFDLLVYAFFPKLAFFADFLYLSLIQLGGNFAG
jgi:hypothetical protein